MDIFSQIWNWICGLLEDALAWIVGLLPSSPFKALDNSVIAEYLPYINWFFPFDFVLATLQLWLVAVAGYYIYSAILRWLKTIK